jgi:uncharacterized protein YqeY
MATRDQLNADLRDALRAGNEVRKVAIRGLLTSIRYAEIEQGKELDDAAIQGVVAKEIRQRRDSIAEYDKAGRTDLVAKEEAEIAALSPYMPPQISREDIAKAARGVIERLGAKGPADKGKVMPEIMGELRGRADGREINAVVTELLSELT